MKTKLVMVAALFLTACQPESQAERIARSEENYRQQSHFASKVAERKRTDDLEARNLCPSREEMAVWTPDDVRTQNKEHRCRLMCPSRQEQRWIARNIHGGIERLRENGCRQLIPDSNVYYDDPTIVVGPSAMGGIPMGGGLSMNVF